MESSIVAENAHQMDTARARQALVELGQPFFDRIKAAGKAMLYMCSDGRYSGDIMNYLIDRTDGADLHTYSDHGGAMILAKQCGIMPADSTLKRDRLAMIKAAHQNMGYDILINCIHGPECKALCGGGIDMKSAFDRYTTVPDELRQHMPGLQVLNLVHREKEPGVLRLYGFETATWRRLRLQFPDPIPLPGQPPFSLSDSMRRANA